MLTLALLPASLAHTNLGDWMGNGDLSTLTTVGMTVNPLHLLCVSLKKAHLEKAEIFAWCPVDQGAAKNFASCNYKCLFLEILLAQQFRFNN